MSAEIETCINWCEPGWAFMSSNERRWVNHIRKLAARKPDECIIIRQPEQNDGFILAKFPQKWAKVSPPRECTLPPEELQKRAENLRQYREKMTKEEGAGQ